MIGDIICTTLYFSCWGCELGDAEEHLLGDVLKSCIALLHDSFGTYRMRERTKKEMLGRRENMERETMRERRERWKEGEEEKRERVKEGEREGEKTGSLFWI